MSTQILNGNELLIQGGLEAGFHLYTGYPGSPLADFFNILYEKKAELKERGIRVVIANSEANAAAMVSGAKMAGQHALVAMKSMGLHVAADALSVGNFANPGTVDEHGRKAAVVVAVGDDPWSISTSTPADSRYLFKHLHIPFLEPSTPQELKDWMKVALDLSSESGIYVGILLTTFMAEGGGRVEVGTPKEVPKQPVTLDPSKFNLSENVMVPPNSLMADMSMIKKRFPQFLQVLQKMKLDRTYGNPVSTLGIVSTGAVFETLKQVLEEMKLLNSVHLYKCAGAYALNEPEMTKFLKTHSTCLVVEEKRGFLEGEMRDLVQKEKIMTQVWGKQVDKLDGFPAFGGLSFEIIRDTLLRIAPSINLHVENCQHYVPLKFEEGVPKRLPTFCPGCPHRETLSIMKEIRQDLSQKNIQLVSHGDVGCYSLSFLEPFKEMHDLSAMGQGGALGAGTDLFTSNPSVVLMGDSTFFHSGMTAISNSVQMGHSITYILLDNDNTAMTGHQVTPRTGESVEGLVRPRQDMLDVAKSLGVDEAVKVNPSDRYFYKNLLSSMVERPGVKVVVSDKECGLTFHGRKKREERQLFKDGHTEKTRDFYQINTLACEDCRVCVEMTGCPGLSQAHDGYGTKVMIDPQICVADSYCTKLKACPSFELVRVHDYHPTKYLPPRSQTQTLQLSEVKPKLSLADVANGKDWRGIVIGVGGSGVTTISRIIAEAAQGMSGRDDLDFKFVDQKGLAQRNGSVTSHLALFSKDHSHGQVVPEGSAIVVVSPDLLEGARALPFLSSDGLMIVDEDFQVPLSIMLDKGREVEPPTPADIQLKLQNKLGDRLIVGPFKRLCFERFQKSVYASAMLLGVMYECGVLPFALGDIKTAFKSALPKTEFDPNWEAFEWGRKWRSQGESSQEVKDDTIELYSKSVALAGYPWQNRQELVNDYNRMRREWSALIPGIPDNHWAQYAHDVIVYDQGKSLPKLTEDLKKLSQTNWTPDELSIAVRALVKTYWIKDEVYVSHLMTSPVKLKMDQERYQKLGTSFEILPMNRPGFDLFGKKIEFDISPKPWMLKIMRNLRVLRKFMPAWHSEERAIAQKIRHEILTVIPTLATEKRRGALKDLDNIKGYREVRYQKAKGLSRIA